MKKLKQKIEYCGLSYKTELIKITCFNIFLFLLDLIIFIYLDNVNLMIWGFLFELILNYLFLSTYTSKAKKLEEERESEFVTIISYFQVFISHRNNVYQSFQKIIPYCGDWMKERLLKLLSEIDEDKTIQPFINFASNFKIKIGTNVMLSIYTMVDQGESFEQINHFQLIFDQLLKSKKIENLDKKKRSLSILASLPLIGAALITVILTISVISIIGELVNVI